MLLVLRKVFPGCSMEKNLAAIEGDMVSFLSQEDPLETEMATNSSVLAWDIPGTETPGMLQSMGLQKN